MAMRNWLQSWKRSQKPVTVRRTRLGLESLEDRNQPATWTPLRVQPPMQKVYCGYVVRAGRGGDATNLGVKADEFGLNVAPATDWYYLLAHCDLDGNAARDSYYFTWSGDTAVQKQNDGR